MNLKTLRINTNYLGVYQDKEALKIVLQTIALGAILCVTEAMRTMLMN